MEHLEDGSYSEPDPFEANDFPRIENLIEKEHQAIEIKLAELIDGEGLSINDRRNLFNEIKHDVLFHMIAEENIYYKKSGKLEKVEDMQVQESLQEHHQIKFILNELDDVAVEEVEWNAKLRVLCEDIKHHHREEEEEFLSATKEAWSDKESEEISKEFLKFKKQANL